MTTKFVLVAICCALSLSSVCATEDSQIRQAALQKLVAQRKIVDEYTFKITFHSENNRINTLTNNRLDHGNVLSERAHFEIKQLGASYRFIAGLMNASSAVITCMEEKTKEAQRENEKQLMEKFYRPVRESQHKADKAELDKMFDWNDERTVLYKEYTELYDQTMNTIKRSESPAAITTALETTLPKGEHLIETAKENIAAVRKLQMDQLVLADNSLNVFRKHIRESVDGLVSSLQNCFLVQSSYYNLKNILNKIM